MTERSAKLSDWDRRQWAGEEAAVDSRGEAKEAHPEPAVETRWNKADWVGEDASGHRPARQAPEDMPEGEPGLSGSRHNPGVQSWASAEPAKATDAK
jgi:hypothetical protein